MKWTLTKDDVRVTITIETNDIIDFYEHSTQIVNGHIMKAELSIKQKIVEDEVDDVDYTADINTNLEVVIDLKHGKVEHEVVESDISNIEFLYVDEDEIDKDELVELIFEQHGEDYKDIEVKLEDIE